MYKWVKALTGGDRKAVRQMSEKIIYPAAGSRELTAFADGFMARYDYPEAAVREFDRIFARLESEANFASEMAETVENYMFPTADGMDEALKKLASMAERFGENEHTLDFVFVLCCLPILKVRYAEAGIGEDIFYNTCDDLRCKLGECIECEGVPGTFVASWYNGILTMEIFGLGRFEYELWEHDEEDYIAPCGKALRHGDPEINFHIPSSGVPITDEARLDSYKRAYEFYKDKLVGGVAFFRCNSWLLYPDHREFLPENSNILRFMDDFDIVSYKVWPELGDLWRIFGRYADRAPEELPTDTALRRAYAERIRSGGTLGKGFGYIVFDGEKILK